MVRLVVLDHIRELVLFIYKIRFPDDERFCLQQQARRAIVSVSLNVLNINKISDKK